MMKIVLSQAKHEGNFSHLFSSVAPDVFSTIMPVDAPWNRETILDDAQNYCRYSIRNQVVADVVTPAADVGCG